MRLLLSLIIFFLLFIIACSKKSEVDEALETVVMEEDEIPFSLDYPEIKYQQIELKDRATINEIQNKYKDDSTVAAAYRKALRTLNRKELRFWRVGETVVVPDSVIADMRAYSIFPDAYFAARHIPKIVIIDNEYQAYACYEYGKLVRFAACNTGKERTPTFPGRYSMVWRQKLRLSSLDSNWKMPWTINFHKYAGNAMHEYEMPGRPVSHSCVRQFSDDAEWIYRWGEMAKYDEERNAIPFSGTPLIVVNVFDFSRTVGGPWLELKSNKSYYVKLPENPMEVEEALIPWVQIPISSRGAIPNRSRFLSAEDTLRARGIIREGVVLTETVDFNKKRREERAAKEAQEKRKRELEAASASQENETTVEEQQE